MAYRDWMRVASHRSTLVSAVLLATLLSAALAGCAESPRPLPSATRTPDAAPVFASDEEALAAAEKAYAAYLAVDNAVAQSGGKGDSAYSKVAVGDALQSALTNAKQFRDAGAHITGEASFSTKELQSAEYSSPDGVSVSFYICDDLSDVQLIGEAGESPSENEIHPHAPFLVHVIAVPGAGLRISNIDLWNGEDYCE